MKLHLTKKDGVIVLVASVLLLGIVVVGRLLLKDAFLIVVAVLFPIVMLAALLEVYRRLSEDFREKHDRQEFQRNQDYRQIESFFSLFFTLKPSLPLPSTRGWAASPDLLNKLIELILIEKPALVLEAGSGVSTLIIAYCLKRLGKGKMFSLEHDAKFAAATQSLIAFHGLEDIATVVHAPLKKFEIHGEIWLWYELDSLKMDQPVDLLVVDGPPGEIQKLARYPALPLLFGRLSSRSSIILDDGNRKDEKDIVALWEKKFPQIRTQFLDLERGAFLIHKNEPADNA